jgi:protein tyrosine phosphatase (PTP) superfamily phosphohydrolase (DUF442 family)
LPNEAASVGRLDMTYIHIPVDFQNPTDKDFEKFCTEMARLKEVAVHVHCIANYRVSAFFYRYRRDVLGMDEARVCVPIWNRFGTPRACGRRFVSRKAAIRAKEGDV